MIWTTSTRPTEIETEPAEPSKFEIRLKPGLNYIFGIYCGDLFSAKPLADEDQTVTARRWNARHFDPREYPRDAAGRASDVFEAGLRAVNAGIRSVIEEREKRQRRRRARRRRHGRCIRCRLRFPKAVGRGGVRTARMKGRQTLVCRKCHHRHLLLDARRRRR